LKNGYTLLKRRYRTPYGEIDAILKNENSLIALEVKQRRTMAESAESISRRQQLRISKSFLFFVSGLEEKFDFYRINVMFFDSAGHMNYIENAFYLEDDEA
jgi:putative endonuclease